jgi:hypothetical protein
MLIKLKMKSLLKIRLVATAILLLSAINGYSQVNRPSSGEYYGNTLNLGLGLPYVHDWGRVPYFTANYEFNVSKNITIAPFIGYLSFRSETGYPWNGNYFHYRQTVVPIGAKGTFYFDRLLRLSSRWDIYAALSAGYIYSHEVWDAGFYGNKEVAASISNLYLDLHIGAEYHINRRTGLFLDLSRNVSTFGVALHRGPHMRKGK